MQLGRVAERLISELTSYHASGEGWQSGKCHELYLLDSSVVAPALEYLQFKL
jgi:hypothetical protein